MEQSIVRIDNNFNDSFCVNSSVIKNKKTKTNVK